MVYCYSFLIQENFLFPDHNCGKIAVSDVKRGGIP